MTGESSRVVISLVLGAIFARAGAAKLGNPDVTASSLAAVIPSRRYSRKLLLRLVRGLALVELATGLGLVVAHGSGGRLIALWAAVLLAAFLVYRLVAAEKDQPCGCLDAKSVTRAPRRQDLAMSALVFLAALFLVAVNAHAAPIARVTNGRLMWLGPLLIGALGIYFVRGAIRTWAANHKPEADVQRAGPVGSDPDRPAELDQSRRGFLKKLLVASGAIAGLQQAGPQRAFAASSAVTGDGHARPSRAPNGFQISSLPRNRVLEMVRSAHLSREWTAVVRAVESKGLRLRLKDAYAARVSTRQRGVEDWLFVPYLGNLAIGWTRGEPLRSHDLAAGFVPRANSEAAQQVFNAIVARQDGLTTQVVPVDEGLTRLAVTLASRRATPVSTVQSCGPQLPCPCPLDCCQTCWDRNALACALICAALCALIPAVCPTCYGSCLVTYLGGSQGCVEDCSPPTEPTLSEWGGIGLAGTLLAAGPFILRRKLARARAEGDVDLPEESVPKD